VDRAPPGLHDLIDQILDHIRIFALTGELQDAPTALARIRAQDAEIKTGDTNTRSS